MVSNGATSECIWFWLEFRGKSNSAFLRQCGFALVPLANRTLRTYSYFPHTMGSAAAVVTE